MVRGRKEGSIIPYGLSFIRANRIAKMCEINLTAFFKSLNFSINQPLSLLAFRYSDGETPYIRLNFELK